MHARYRLPSRRSTYHSRTTDLERKLDDPLLFSSHNPRGPRTVGAILQDVIRRKVAVAEGVTITRGSQCEPASNRLKKRFATVASHRAGIRDVKYNTILIDGAPEIMLTQPWISNMEAAEQTPIGAYAVGQDIGVSTIVLGTGDRVSGRVSWD